MSQTTNALPIEIRCMAESPMICMITNHTNEISEPTNGIACATIARPG